MSLVVADRPIGGRTVMTIVVMIASTAVALCIVLLIPASPSFPAARTKVERRSLPTWLPPLLLFAGSAIAIGGPIGVVTGVVLGVLARLVLPRFESASARRNRLARERQLPLFIDLLAACLSAGIVTDEALLAAAAAVGEPLAKIVETAVTSIRWGADPVATWRSVEAIDGLHEVAGALVRSVESGSPLAELLPQLARDARDARRTRMEARTRTAGVRLMAPLGLMFLPAFVLLGVVPVVASWASVLLGMR
jgi:pilus assembly protein TadC